MNTMIWPKPYTKNQVWNLHRPRTNRKIIYLFLRFSILFAYIIYNDWRKNAAPTKKVKLLKQILKSIEREKFN